MLNTLGVSVYLVVYEAGSYQLFGLSKVERVSRLFSVVLFHWEGWWFCSCSLVTGSYLVALPPFFSFFLFSSSHRRWVVIIYAQCSKASFVSLRRNIGYYLRYLLERMKEIITFGISAFPEYQQIQNS